MSDEAYDVLRQQYKRYTNTPSQIGISPPGSKQKILHTRRVLSLQKAYTDAEIEKFLQQCGRENHFCIEPKIDGLSIILRYLNGELTQALTRGDGTCGTDVTAAVIASGCTPLKLSDTPKILEVRGELFITLEDFQALNALRITDGQPPLKSPRNTAAGTLRMKDPKEIAERNLQILIFEIIETDTMPTTHSGQLRLASSYGLPVIKSRAASGSEVIQKIEELNKHRPELPYSTDGIIVRLNDSALFLKMGSNSHHPHGAIARKYHPTPATARLLKIEWSRGKKGRLTPIAHFEPVDLEGATVQRATLHNLNHLRALDLMIGDRVQVIRSGGCIPEIIGRCPTRNGSEKPIPDPY